MEKYKLRKKKNERHTVVETPYVKRFRQYLKDNTEKFNRIINRKKAVVDLFVKESKRKDNGEENNIRIFQKKRQYLIQPYSNVYLNDLFYFCKVFDISPNEILGEKEKKEPESYTVYDNFFLYFTDKEMRQLRNAVERNARNNRIKHPLRFLLPVTYHVATGYTMYCHFIVEDEFKIEYLSSFYNYSELLYRLEREFKRPRKIKHLYFKKIEATSYEQAETLFMRECNKYYLEFIKDLQDKLTFVSDTDEIKELIRNNKFFNDLYRYDRKF